MSGTVENVKLIDWYGRERGQVLATTDAIEFVEVDPQVHGMRNMYRRDPADPLVFRFCNCYFEIGARR